MSLHYSADGYLGCVSLRLKMPLCSFRYKSPSAPVQEFLMTKLRCGLADVTWPQIALQVVVPISTLSAASESPSSSTALATLDTNTFPVCQSDRCEMGLLPEGALPQQLPGRLGIFSHWGFLFIQFPIHMPPHFSTWHLSFFLLIYNFLNNLRINLLYVINTFPPLLFAFQLLWCLYYTELLMDQSLPFFIWSFCVLFKKSFPFSTLLRCWWECKLVQPVWRAVWRFLKKLKIELPYDPAIPLLGIHLDKTLIQKDTCTPMFIAALFTIAKTQKQPKCPSTKEWIKKMWYIHTMEYYSAIKQEWSNAVCSNRDGPRDYYTKWSKSERERQIPYDITYMWNLKYDTNELIYETETDSQT